MIRRFFPQVTSMLNSTFANKAPNSLNATALNGFRQVKSDNEIESFVEQLNTKLPKNAETPKISVIIPVYGMIGHTLNCLKSIADNPPKVSFEIIVIDDKSQDGSVHWLRKINKIRLLENSKNLGFIRSCNSAAHEARGEFLHFLNNDTFVTAGWLDNLYETFFNFSNVGLVGSKLIYPDGSLQEAGGILWNDGSAWNYGNRGESNKPEYSYARQVDYCSGASLLIRKATFHNFNGFDELFLPAYCEDSDLAMKISSSGQKVIYQSNSIVFHLEGGTSGTDLEVGPKAFQVINSGKLADRWSEALSTHNPNGLNPTNEKDRFRIGRVLVLDHDVPQPDRDAGSLTAVNMMILLREFGYQVTFASGNGLNYHGKYVPLLQKLGIEVLYQPYVHSLQGHLETTSNEYDLALIFRPLVAEESISIIRSFSPGTRILYHTVDLHFLRLEREGELLGDELSQVNAEKFKKLELSLVRDADLSIVHSQVEFDILRKLDVDTEKLMVFPLLLNMPKIHTRFDERSGIVFFGNFNHAPNTDAIQYFCKEVFPHIRKMNPGITLTIIGSNVNKKIISLAAENIIVKGFIEDLDEAICQHRLSIAPLRYGAGIKGKVGKSLACGTPVVASSIAAEGMGLRDKTGVIVADDQIAFAEAVCKLYGDKLAWDELSASGRDFASSTWGFAAGLDYTSQILNRLELPWISSIPDENLLL